MLHATVVVVCSNDMRSVSGVEFADDWNVRGHGSSVEQTLTGLVGGRETTT